jgi:NAD(P)H-dependent FMN reductase
MAKIIYLLYFSQTGNTKRLAEQVHLALKKLKNDDLTIEYKNADEFFRNPNALDLLRKANGYILGSPDYFSYPSGWIKIFFDLMYDHRDEIKDRPIMGFITHGGGGRAAKEMTSLMKSVKLHAIEPIISVKLADINPKVIIDIEKCCKTFIALLR